MEAMNSSFGYAVLAWVPGAFVANMVLSGPVMAARSKFGVEYPNLYAVHGHHKNVDEFNAVQRGHQNFLYVSACVSELGALGAYARGPSHAANQCPPPSARAGRETIHAVQLMALFGSLHSEKAALANVVGAACFYTGAYLYGKGYAKHWNKKNGRYKSGGAIKYIGILAALVTSVMTGLKISGLSS
jgi:hypothetical protein